MHPRDLPPCDLVMKGGVTSGIVYPGAVLELSVKYRFEQVGGTSAGAVAAAMIAAAEYARQRSGSLELPGLESTVEELKKPGYMPSLFQPAPAARPMFSMAMAVMAAGHSHARQTRALAAAAIRYRPVHLLLATVGATGILALLAAALGNLGVVAVVVLALLGALGLMLLAIWAVLGPLVSMVRSVWRILPEQGFGICPGMRQPGAPGEALTEWLHATVQRCAELPLDQPLTFAMLERHGIGLRMVGTDLGLARPVTIPFDAEQYLFSPAELRRLFPTAVADCVCRAAGIPEPEWNSSRTWFMPGKELPVVIGARLSSSVPLLLSSLRLYAAHAQALAPIECFISDGGITSNFPIHFFDDWLPSHPTFGLDLVPGADPAMPDIFMASGTETGPLIRTAPVRGLVGFLRQIEDASRNWRDQIQAELPGNRDRVCQIRMHAGEGGFNLAADAQTVERLLQRGRGAGREILGKFDWDQHRLVRYAMLMELLSENLSLLADRFVSYREWLHGAGPTVAETLVGRDAAWLAAAEQATSELLEHAPTEIGVQAVREHTQPEPAMRIGPRL